MAILNPPTGPVYVSSSDIAEAERRAAELEVPAPTFVTVAPEDRVAELRVGRVDSIPNAHLAIQESVNKINELIRKEPGTWNYRGDWVDIVKYKAYDVVIFDGRTWLALQNGLNEEPAEASLFWTALTEGSTGGSSLSLPLDIPPAVAHANNDEFPGVALNAKWTNPAVTANALSLSVANGWLRMEPSAVGSGFEAKRFHGIRQAAPAGSFSVSALVAAFRPKSGITESYDGVFVGVAGGKGHVLGAGQGSALASVANMGATTYGEGATDWSAFDGFNNVLAATQGFTLCRYQIRWLLATTTLEFWYSINGGDWAYFMNRAAMAQPTSIGLGMYAQGNSFASDKFMMAKWFRVTEP